MIEIILSLVIGGIISFFIAKYFYEKSPSKSDIAQLKEVNEKFNASTQEVIKKGFGALDTNNQLSYNIHLENLLNSQFNRYLEHNKFDKNLLIRELEGEKIETLYIIKQKEEDDKKLLRERIKLLGFKHVTFGDWILPPKKLKNIGFLKQKNGVKKWVEDNLISGITTKDFVNSVVIINLSNIYDEEKGTRKKAKKIIGGVLKPTDLVSKEKLLSDIYKSNKITLREIVQVPFLDALIDYEHPELAGIVKDSNSRIVEKIKGKLKLQNLKTTDIANLKNGELEDILDSLDIKNSRSISKQIMGSVKILDSYLNKDGVSQNGRKF